MSLEPIDRNEPANHSCPANGSPPLTGDLPGDPFNPSRLRLGQDFAVAGGTQRHLTRVPVRKPTKEEWIRVHPSSDYTVDTLILELKGEREYYLIAPEMHDELSTESTVCARRLVTSINRQGTVFIWPLRLPGMGGRTDSWADTALEASVEATRTWLRIESDMSIGAYVYYTPRANLPEPEFPVTPFQELLKLAFRQNYINSPDHIVLRRLKGEL